MESFALSPARADSMMLDLLLHRDHHRPSSGRTAIRSCASLRAGIIGTAVGNHRELTTDEPRRTKANKTDAGNGSKDTANTVFSNVAEKQEFLERYVKYRRCYENIHFRPEKSLWQFDCFLLFRIPRFFHYSLTLRGEIFLAS